MNTDGLALIGRLTSLPCLPHDFAHSGAVDSIVQVIRTMAEVAPNETVLYLIKIVDASMAETSDFWDGLESNASLCKLVELSRQSHVLSWSNLKLKLALSRRQRESTTIPETHNSLYSRQSPSRCLFDSGLHSWPSCEQSPAEPHEFWSVRYCIPLGQFTSCLRMANDSL